MIQILLHLRLGKHLVDRLVRYRLDNMFKAGLASYMYGIALTSVVYKFPKFLIVVLYLFPNFFSFLCFVVALYILWRLYK